MTVLVTGAAGFIGFHLARALLQNGQTVVGLDNLNDYYDVSLKEARLEQLAQVPGDRFTFHKASLEDASALLDICKTHKVDQIVHLAAQAGVRHSITNPRQYIDSNITGFLGVLEAARDCEIEHLVYASSSSVYGNSADIPFSTDANVNRPVSIYAATKIADELFAQVFHHQFNLNLTGLRFFTVYGPWGRPDMSPFLFLDAILKGEPVKLFNNGQHRRDFTYVDDIVEGIVRVLVKKTDAPQNRIYNIGRGEPIELLDYVQTLETLTAKEAIKTMLPMQPGDVEETFADVSPLERDFGYQPATSLEEGLARFVSWYRDYYGL